MAITDPYCTVNEYLAYFGRDDTSSSVDILRDLTATSRTIEGRLGITFNADAADTTRVYPVNRDTLSADGLTLTITDISAAPTSVKIADPTTGLFTGAALVLATDYDLGPLSAPWGPEPKPWTQLVLRSTSAFRWSTGATVQVVGKFGWPAVPAGVKTACIHMTALLRLETPRASSRIAEGMETTGVTPDAQNIIRSLLDQYRVHYFA